MDRGRGRLAARRPVRPPQAARRRHRRSPPRAICPAERLAEPLELLDIGTTAELIELGGWIADRYASARSRGIALALPPGAGTGKKPRAARSRTERVRDADRRRHATRSTGGGGAARASASARCSRRSRDSGELSDRELARSRGPARPVVRRLAERGLVETTRTPGAPPPGAALGRRRARRGRRSRRPSAPPPTRRSRRSTARARASCCCTGSPARARPRSTWRRSRPASSAAGPRSCSCPRSG